MTLVHELRNPLNAALTRIHAMEGTMSGRLEKPAPTPAEWRVELVDYLRALLEIETAVRRAERMVEMALAPHLDGETRVTLDEPDVEEDAGVDLEEVLDDLQEEIQTLHGARKISVRLSPGLPRLLGAREAIEHVLSCMLYNACRYAAPPTPIGVIARPYTSADEGLAPPLATQALLPRPYVYLQIYDFGPGIPVVEHEHVFAPFYRLRREVGMSKGLGLGLYICRGMVRVHHGAIWIGNAAHLMSDEELARRKASLPEGAKEGEGLGTTVHVLWPAATRGKVRRHGRRPART
jgi:signal transduction histidine kinase